MPSRTAILGAFEDKSAHFVLFESTFARFWARSRTKLRFLSSFWLSELPFPALPSAKTHILRAFGLPHGTFKAFRAQNCTFCALLILRSAIFWPSERKITLFARFWSSEAPFSGFLSAKSHFLRAFGPPKRHFLAFRAQNCTFCALGASGRKLWYWVVSASSPRVASEDPFYCQPGAFDGAVLFECFKGVL